MRKQWIIFVLVLFQLSFLNTLGQAAEGASKTIFEKIEVMKTHVNQENWDQATKMYDQLDLWYRKNRWKLQLLGDEAEYEEVAHDISRIRITLEEKDKLESKMLIENLKTTLKQIANF